MPFTTLAFIGFFAALFIAYYAMPKRCQWWSLLAGSMFFYGYASPFYLLLLWATILVTYFGTIAIGKSHAKRDEYLKLHKQELSREEKKAYKASVESKTKRYLTVTILILLVMLGVFKYAQFAIDNFLELLGLFGVSAKADVVLNIILPVGLSFYLFQSIGYCIDVYREEVLPECNLFKHALFVSFFPQIMQGPIGRYGTLAPQLLVGHDFYYDQVKFGLLRMAWGFFKKFMIANTVANRIDIVWTHPEGHFGVMCWMFLSTLYAIQLYADFSGYMDIACGCSQMLGIRIDENFNLPYFSKSVPEFWRRWHMTLSAWFKDYLFYPLLRSDWNSGLRKRLCNNKYLASVLPTSMALAVVWFATGLWHGASWGYVAWGVYYGGFMVANIALQPLYDGFHTRFPKLVASKFYVGWQIIRTFLIVVIGYTIFKPANLLATMKIWRNALTGDQLAGMRTVPHVGERSWFFLMFVIGILFLVDIWHLRHENESLRRVLSKKHWCFRWFIYVVSIFLVVFTGMYSGQYQQFEYFKF